MAQRLSLSRSSTDHLSRLKSVRLFESLNPDVLSELTMYLGWEYVPGGETLFRQGEPGDTLYVVLNGRLRVYVERSGEGEQVIGEVAQGETVGEIAVLTGEPRSATVRAIRDTELMKLSKPGFERLLAKHPQSMTQLAKSIAGRVNLRGPSLPASKTLRTVAIIPCHRDVPLRDFVARLIPLFDRIGPTLHMDRAKAERAVGNGELASPDDQDERSVIAGVLNDLERPHRFILYEADCASTTWSRWCVRQADYILLLGSAACEPSVTEVEDEGVFRVAPDNPTARTELVLLHGNGDLEIAGIAQWLAARKIDGHHHVNLSSPGDLERLVRLITGRSVALVLSGGAARGFAQIGVIRALRESGIPIDYIGGTSMGAVIGAQLALGWDHETLVRENRKNWVQLRPLKDYTFPMVGLLSGGKTRHILVSMFGDVTIEDLPVNYFCMSSNLTLAQPAVHRRGALWRWVRASISMPGVGPPLVHNGQMFVDGGVLNNLPIDVMSKLCEGCIVAAYTSERETLPTNMQDLDTLSGWRLLWSRCNPFTKAPCAPNIFSILVRTMMLSSLRSMKQLKSEADVFIDPPVSEIGRFEWNAIDRFVEIGYRTAQTRIEEWQTRRTAGPSAP